MLKQLLIGVSVMLISLPGYADKANISAQQGGMLNSLLMFGVIFVMFYLLMIRPQSKRQKEHKDLITNLTVGDEVIISGGIVGKIAKVTDNFFMLTISEGVTVPVQKQAIVNALPKGTIKSL